jgi:hypothetical protein
MNVFPKGAARSSSPTSPATGRARSETTGTRASGRASRTSSAWTTMPTTASPIRRPSVAAAPWSGLRSASARSRPPRRPSAPWSARRRVSSRGPPQQGGRPSHRDGHRHRPSYRGRRRAGAGQQEAHGRHFLHIHDTAAFRKPLAGEAYEGRRSRDRRPALFSGAALPQVPKSSGSTRGEVATAPAGFSAGGSRARRTRWRSGSP